MSKMIRKRLVSLCIILFGLSILTFGLTYLLPSNPVEELITSMGGSHDPEVVAKLEEQYGTSRHSGSSMQTGFRELYCMEILEFREIQ